MSNLADPMHHRGDAWPTPQEWVERFHAADPEQQVDIARRVIEASQVASNCLAANHEAMQETLQRITPVGYAASAVAQVWQDEVAPSEHRDVVAAVFPSLARAIESLKRETHKPPAESPEAGE